MGTNYFLIRDCCPHCGRGREELHIGKSSAGWMFGLAVHPDEGINSLEDWMNQWSQPNTRIKDEYGDIIPTERMIEVICNRAWSGPGGLRRHEINDFCIAHGPGTYDLMYGWFR